MSISSHVFAATVVVALATIAATISVVDAFSSPVFQEVHTLRRHSPSKIEGVEIELPDFEELFSRIRQVSPLADKIISGEHTGKGLKEIDDGFHPVGYKWKTVESNARRIVHQVDKIDNFQELGTPLLRFRSTIDGPFVPEKFADLIMEIDDRARWDPAIAEVDERYPIHDLDAANIAMNFEYGSCSKLGVGYCRTKQSVVSPREQLTLCGIQDFECGSSLIWGTEMEEWHNHLLPGDKRHTRAKSHLFSVALTPNGRPESFDVEYILQLEIGGKIPNFMVAPIVSESVKNMFKHAKDVFGGRDGEIDDYIAELKAKQAQEVKLEATASTAVEDVMRNEMPRQLVRTS